MLTGLCFSQLHAQHGISLYHLHGATFQNSQFNAAHVPEDGKFFLGLPVLSGINLHVNSKLSYNELITTDTEGTIIDISKAIDNLGRQNGLSAHLNVNLLHLGFRLGNNALLSFFANERVEFDFLFPREGVQLLWEGNASFLEETVELGRFALALNHFREIGVGYAVAPENSPWKIGIRAKYLQGIFNANLPANLRADVLTENENAQLNLDLQNGTLRTAGIEIARGEEGDIGSHIISNGNSGVAVDLGAEYKLNRSYSLALGVNDIGFINWKDGIRNYSLNDTTFRYVGAQFRPGTVQLRDSIENFVEQFEDIDEDTLGYTSFISPRIFGSVIWKARPRLSVISTVSARIIQGQTRLSFGVGGRYQIGRGLVVSANVTKLDQQFFNVGAAIAANVSIVQIYLASDHVIGYSAPDLDAADIRFGINFVFRGKDKTPKFDGGSESYSYGKVKQSKSKTKGEKGVRYGYFLGEEVKIKGKDSIYSLIKKQKRRQLKTKKSAKPKFYDPPKPKSTNPRSN